MTTRSIVHEEVFDTTPEALFELLHTPSSICSWWSTTHAMVIPREGGAWAATWGGTIDEPDFASFATISRFEPPRHFVLSEYVYKVLTPLPFEADFVTAFEVRPDAEGARLIVTNSGFPAGPEADDFYAGCVQGWKDTFAGIRRFLESKASN